MDLTDATMSMSQWLKEHQHQVFRYWIYKKMFTPYEQEGKFIDESVFEDTHCNLGCLLGGMDLGNGEWLLAFRYVDEIDGLGDSVHYHKLSDIRLEQYDDQYLLDIKSSKE